MKITFLGAAHEVTGSCTLLEVCGKKILIDCGMEQGPDIYENSGIPYPPADIDYVFLTHAHIDHSRKAPAADKERLPRKGVLDKSNTRPLRDNAGGLRTYSGDRGSLEKPPCKALRRGRMYSDVHNRGCLCADEAVFACRLRRYCFACRRNYRCFLRCRTSSRLCRDQADADRRRRYENRHFLRRYRDKGTSASLRPGLSGCGGCRDN